MIYQVLALKVENKAKLIQNLKLKKKKKKKKKKNYASLLQKHMVENKMDDKVKVTCGDLQFTPCTNFTIQTVKAQSSRASGQS